MLFSLWLTLTAAAPAGAPDGGIPALTAQTPELRAATAQELGDTVTLPTERFMLKRSLTQWLAAHAPGAAGGEDKPELLKAGGYTAFQHGDVAGVVEDATQVLSTWTAERADPLLRLIALPGPRAGLLLCSDFECGDDGYRCAKALLNEHRRRCTWVAPQCPGVPAIDLSMRFNRISVENKVITADVFNQAPPTCVPTDGPTPRWTTERVRLGSWGPSTLLRGTLEAHACAPPTWKHAVGHFSRYEGGDENDPVDPVYGRLTPLALPRCR